MRRISFVKNRLKMLMYPYVYPVHLKIRKTGYIIFLLSFVFFTFNPSGFHVRSLYALLLSSLANPNTVHLGGCAAAQSTALA